MEYLDIRTENGELTGEIKERTQVHTDGDIHGTSHVWLVRYTDKNKNEIDVNSVNGIFVILNDIMDNCNDENICLCVKENIKACIEKCYNDRIKELKTDKHQDKSIG